MTDRATIAREAAAQLKTFSTSMKNTPVLIGFDGFVDSIIAVVNTRKSPKEYQAVATIDQFGKKILAAAGQSSNYELVTKLQKLGGNGPIMANAMAAIGLPTTYVGCLGHPAVHPVFEELTQRATVLSISDPGFTDALEFDDGKLMLGKHATLGDVNWKRVAAVVGEAKFGKIVAGSKLIGMVNWTMLPNLATIWQQMVKSILPALKGKDRKRIFFDLADPEKRTREDLLAALKLVAKFEKFVDVTLGLNLKEAGQVAAVLGVAVKGDPECAIEETAKGIRAKLDINTVVIHPRGSAAAATKTAAGVESATFAGPLVQKPKLSTGAGDNFNAGFCLGQIAGLSVAQALCVGTATSGYYVRNAGSPSLAQLIKFTGNLPAPEGA